jgi:hypothetical protein
MKSSFFLYRLFRTHTQNQNLKIKKILNPDPSPPGLDPGVEEGGRHRPRREGGVIAAGQGCAAEVCRWPRSELAVGSRLEPRPGWGGGACHHC